MDGNINPFLNQLSDPALKIVSPISDRTYKKVKMSII